LSLRVLTWVLAATVAAGASGCSVSQKTVVKPGQAPTPLQTATKEQLIAQYEREAQAIHSLNAAVTMKLTAGSAYSGVIEQYHEVKGFILAQKPASIRVIGQAPVVGKNIFDMVSDGETFRIFIPSKNKFLVGSAKLERPSAKPIENLRPQHILDALFFRPIPDNTPVLFEEAGEAASHFYVLTVVRQSSDSATRTSSPGSMDWEIALKIWFDRTNLGIARVQTFRPVGKLISDVRYSTWQPVDSASYPRQIALSQPANDYQLQIGIEKLTVNDAIAADRFQLQQPPGTELVRIGEEAKEVRP
jgi:outer membrane lipoprotein-sorting protein